MGESAAGDLTRSRNGRPQNPFDEGQDLLGHAHNAAKYFRFNARHARLMNVSAGVEGGVANVKPQLRLCTTRIASRCNEVHSVLRLWKGITMWVLEYPAVLLSHWFLCVPWSQLFEYLWTLAL